MTQNPFGNPDAPLTGDSTSTPAIVEPSILDNLLDLDGFLSGEKKLAEKTARFCTEPALEAEIDALEEQLSHLVDENGRPRTTGDDSLADDTAAKVLTLAQQIHELRHRYAAAIRSVRMRQLPDDEWDAFKVEHRKAFESQGISPERTAMYDALLVRSAHAPAINAAQLKKLRAHVGGPQVTALVQAAWDVNTGSGVSVPFSRISSAVLKQAQRSQS